ncbi:MAG: hypothetical protein MUC49_19135 [Raineya sp.]|jgi:hypothetical protein|nr:hypothetical protein [Raineya sp.]
MKFLWATFVFFAFHLSILAQNCLPLKDGDYTLYFNNSKFKQNIKIVGKKWHSELNGEVTEFEIIEMRDCAFRLKSSIPPDTTRMSNFEKILEKRVPYYDITKREQNIYYFTLRIDLHVQSDSGMLIRKMIFKRRKN